MERQNIIYLTGGLRRLTEPSRHFVETLTRKFQKISGNETGSEGGWCYSFANPPPHLDITPQDLCSAFGSVSDIQRPMLNSTLRSLIDSMLKGRRTSLQSHTQLTAPPAITYPVLLEPCEDRSYKRVLNHVYLQLSINCVHSYFFSYPQHAVAEGPRGTKAYEVQCIAHHVWRT
jgi:hypothetical protein